MKCSLAMAFLLLGAITATYAAEDPDFGYDGIVKFRDKCEKGSCSKAAIVGWDRRAKTVTVVYIADGKKSETFYYYDCQKRTVHEDGDSIIVRVPKNKSPKEMGPVYEDYGHVWHHACGK